MKVTFPHMGNMYICLKAMLNYLGVEVVVPPRTSKKTMVLGVQNSPEFACLPMKVNLGNFIEAYEQGADTILMAGGVGPCRFGYYAQVQKEIIEDLGLNYKMIVLEPPQKHISELLAKIKEVADNQSWLRIIKAIRFGWLKAVVADRLEQSIHYLRPRELEQGHADQVYQKALHWIDRAESPQELADVEKKIGEALKKVEVNRNRDIIRIGLVGEIYVLLEPFVNLEIERNLGKLGVEVERSIYLSQWINDHLFMGLLKMKSSKESKLMALPYVNHTVGGHGQESIGSAVIFSQQGYDGVIQVAPFTCMPEIIAESILPTVSRDKDIPTYTLIVDEHSGDAGIVTRLEAFVDLLRRRKNYKEGTKKCMDFLG
ncbi:hypothetical protein Tfer_0470 [Thermincola ferriacetica]|uniref:DUF2229 domain-containing protein n=1 Tax=Thermincola ferriacetica TaxID=281456 RepID=A0A0L6W5P6_9FIRM|nr:acyl-CoA dehydratase activase-related protein [Thermincola ferriacetica]KNZ70791.1 hypothetical protein Tfer_0470 [Thermincola ferriacetica]